jgi:hypothetical protein
MNNLLLDFIRIFLKKNEPDTKDPFFYGFIDLNRTIWS